MITELMSVRRIIHRDPLRMRTIMLLDRGSFSLFVLISRKDEVEANSRVVNDLCIL